LEPFAGEDGWATASELGRIDDRWWAGGDVDGAGIASLATARGRHAAEALHARLRGLEPPTPNLRPPIGRGPVKPDSYDGPPRTVERTRPVEEWLSRPDDEISVGLTEAEFHEEAGRCLSCGNCFGCEQCWMYCAHGCFTRLDEVRPGAYFSLSLDQCKACGKCVDVCPCGFLEVRDPAEAGSGIRSGDERTTGRQES
jgi:Pyruvate/2-oxoacid:ferredoxin oxidoreductase delta subunit